MENPLEDGNWSGSGDGGPKFVDNIEALHENNLPLYEICHQHLEALSQYKETSYKRIEELGRGFVIPTPLSLFPKHLVDRPINEWKAEQLARDRGRLEAATTVFEDPKLFYYYPDHEVIVSARKVMKHRVVPTKSGLLITGLHAYEEGLQFAIFESVYHFNPRKDWNVKPVRR